MVYISFVKILDPSQSSRFSWDMWLRTNSEHKNKNHSISNVNFDRLLNLSFELDF